MKNDLKRDAPLAYELSKKQQTELKRKQAMSKIWDFYTYHIADYFVPALVNEDDSELSDAESEELEAFVDEAFTNAKEDGFKASHWTVEDDSENIGFCDVCDKLANVATVKLMVYKDA